MDEKKKLPKLTGLTSLLDSDTKKRGIYAFSHFLIAFILSLGILFSRFSPMAVAFVAASSGVYAPKRTAKTSKLFPFCALIGSFAGYAVNGSADGLKYMSAALLCYAGGIIFSDIKLFRSSSFMPLMAVFSMIATNSIYLFAGTSTSSDILLFMFETVICGAASYFYSGMARFVPPLHLKKSVKVETIRDESDPFEQYSAAEEDTTKTKLVGGKLGKWELYREVWDKPLSLNEKASVLVVIASVIVSLNGFPFIFGMSAGRILAIAVVLAASSTGSGIGACVGLCTGLALDISSGGAPINAACFGLCGIFAGLLRRTGSLSQCIAFVLAYCATLPWQFIGDIKLPFLYECFFTSVIYFIFHDKIDKYVLYLFPRTVSTIAQPHAVLHFGNTVAERDSGYIQKRLGLLSSAFSNLYNTLVPGVEEAGSGEDPAVMFEAAAMRVCKKCPQSSLCWNADGGTTRTALNDATVSIKKRGRALSSDFPPYFTMRCVHFPEFLTSVNEAIAVSSYRKRFKRRVYDDVRLLCAQYEGMTGVISDVTADLSDTPRVDRKMTEMLTDEIKRRIKFHDFTLLVTIGSMGRMSIEFETNEAQKFNAILPSVIDISSEISGRDLSSVTTSTAGADITKILLTQRETFRAKIGVGLRSRHGEERSGDTCVHFKTSDGKLYLIISDGMGSGADAAAVSSSAVRLLEGFLRCGVSAPTALRLICPAFAIKSESDNFTTVDILCIDLFTGQGEFYKCGAAPSFIIGSSNEGSPIRRITSHALPMGLFAGDALEADKTTITLHNTDTVVMVSDGIADNTTSAPLLKLLSNVGTRTPSEVAAMILDSFPKNDKNDDMTVFVVSLGNSESI